jgi:hypothetical protein
MGEPRKQEGRTVMTMIVVGDATNEEIIAVIREAARKAGVEVEGIVIEQQAEGREG